MRAKGIYDVRQFVPGYVAVGRLRKRTLKFRGTMLSTRITNNMHDFSSSAIANQ